jgi:DNA-binding NtrC family response regulator
VGLASRRTALTVADDPRALLVEVIERHGGRLNWVAHDLGVGRRRLYDRIYALGLWPTVNRARARYREARLRAKRCRTG